MANMRAIKRLREHLTTIKPKTFDMGSWFDTVKVGRKFKQQGYVTTADLIKDGPACHTAACLAGETLIMSIPKNRKLRIGEFGICLPSDPYKKGQEILGLTDEEARWMFFGSWAENRVGYDSDWGGIRLSKVTLKMAIEYLDEVLKVGDVRIKI